MIVDDEISTGKTALAAIEALHDRSPRPHYIVASLVDVRARHHRDAVDLVAARHHTTIDFVSLATGHVAHPDDLPETICSLDPPVLNLETGHALGRSRRVPLPWPHHIPEGGRHGFLRGDREPFQEAARVATEHLVPHLDPRRDVLVVGHEEFMYLPLRIAERLQRQGFNVRFQSTTRSPAYVHDTPRYPLRVGYQFLACEVSEDTPRYLYNGWCERLTGPSQLLLIIDAAAAAGPIDGPGSVVDIMTAAGYDILVAEVAGPDAVSLHRSRRDNR